MFKFGESPIQLCDWVFKRASLFKNICVSSIHILSPLPVSFCP